LVQDESSAVASASGQGFRSQAVTMIKALLASPQRNKVLGLGAGILAVILATSYGQIILNRWNRPFYDAMERRDLESFIHQLGIFVWIAGALLILNVAQAFLNQMIRLKLRQGLTMDLLGEWMQPRRAFRLASAGPIGANPDQRIHEDARHLVDLTTDLGVGLLQSSILLASFVGVLWSLSADFAITISGRHIEIPGYMVWAAFLYAGTASWISWMVGRSLVVLNGNKYAREAELRFSLMHANEHLDAISLAGGEADERRRIELDLGAVLQATRSIIRAVTNLTWVTAGYGWVTVVAPFIIAAPAYFSGDLTFGGLMMAVGAFNQVHESLRWFINNIGGIADFRATLLRVADFRSAVKMTDVLHEVEKRIEIVQGTEDKLVFAGLKVSSPGGSTKLDDPMVEIAPGEHVLINGAPGAGRTLFFRAIAGLWPWGSGKVILPANEPVTFLPRTPYFPPGTLREVLCYPREPGSLSDADLTAALLRLDLGRLAGSLDRYSRWDRELSEEEQRLLAFARLGLHKPKWVVISEAIDLFDGDARKRVMAMLDREFAESTIINIGRPGRDGGYFNRIIHLANDPEGHALRPFRAPTADAIPGSTVSETAA
jgi:vitamin B12/bleomycin/antimicrobial peptide transport system ATP-binding/permease protein